MPGAGHVIWSPSQCKQLQDTVLTDMREAIMEGRCVYSVGLYLQKPRYISGDNAQEISSSDPNKAKEAQDKEQQLKSASGYILYTTHLMVRSQTPFSLHSARPFCGFRSPLSILCFIIFGGVEA